MRQGSKIIATVVGVALAAACSREPTEQPAPTEGQVDPQRPASIDASPTAPTAQATATEAANGNDQETRNKSKSPSKKAKKKKSSRSSLFKRCVRNLIKESVAHARALGGMPDLVDAERFANAVCNLEADKQKEWNKKAGDYNSIMKKYE